MHSQTQEKLFIHVNLEITATALQAIMAQAKNKLNPDTGGGPRMDTADYVGLVITRFLSVKDFETYALNSENYD